MDKRQKRYVRDYTSIISDLRELSEKHKYKYGWGYLRDSVEETSRSMKAALYDKVFPNA